MSDRLAPILLFVFNRPKHTHQVLLALSKADLAINSTLVIFCDGPKIASDLLASREIELIVSQFIPFFKSIQFVKSEVNLGLANSIITGVTKICKESGRVIVLEDDIVVSPNFLGFMNAALDFYEGSPLVGSIHGYWHPTYLLLPSTFFIRGASCWGWATWQRSWELFESDGQKLLQELINRKLTQLFDLDGSAEYTKMLKNQILGKNNSWAIRWHATMFLKGMLQLTPNKSLVKNIGFDGSGTHSMPTSIYNVEISKASIEICEIPIEESLVARTGLSNYHKKIKRSIFEKAYNKIINLIRKLKK